MKTNNYPCSCREAKEDVYTVGLQVTYDADVITSVRKAHLRLLHGNHKTGSTVTMGIARCGCLLIELYMTPTTRTSIVRLSYVALSITSTRLLKLRSATVATSGKTRSTRTYTKDVRPVVTEA